MKNKNLVWILSAPWVAIISGSLLWRWISNQQERPCPPRLTILLENPYMYTVAGADSILDRLEIAPGMQLLDVGCGPGRLTIPAAQRVGPSGQVTALDIQPEMLNRAQEKARVSNCVNIQFVHGGIGTGIVGDNIFDRALLVTVLGEVPDKKEAMTEIYASLKPNGILSVTEVLPDPHYQTYQSVHRLAQGAGFVFRNRWRIGLAYTAHYIKPSDDVVAVNRLHTLT